MAQVIKPIYTKMESFTNVEENALAASLSGQPAGASIIFNSDLNQVRLWSGTVFENPPINTVYQLALESGTNIKTINGESILGAGNLSVSGSGGLTQQQVEGLI
jgi:hypothetical protein